MEWWVLQLGPTLETDHKLEASLESYKRAVLEGTVSKREAQTGTKSQGRAKKGQQEGQQLGRWSSNSMSVTVGYSPSLPMMSGPRQVMTLGARRNSLMQLQPTAFTGKMFGVSVSTQYNCFPTGTLPPATPVQEKALLDPSPLRTGNWAGHSRTGHSYHRLFLQCDKSKRNVNGNIVYKGKLKELFTYRLEEELICNERSSYSGRNVAGKSSYKGKKCWAKIKQPVCGVT